MKNINDENAFYDYRFLVDTQSSREYTIRFAHGKASGIQVFGGSFKPNETIFAISDDDHHNGSKSLNLSAYAFQIQTDGSARPTIILFAPVDYLPDAGAYQLTLQSIQEMKDWGFDDKFPRALPQKEKATIARMNMETMGYGALVKELPLAEQQIQALEKTVRQLHEQIAEMTASKKVSPVKTRKQKLSAEKAKPSRK